MKLNSIEIKALTEIKDGVDVFSPTLACRLLEIRRKHPGLIVTDETGLVGNVKPFFRACCTVAGRAAITTTSQKQGASHV